MVNLDDKLILAEARPKGVIDIGTAQDALVRSRGDKLKSLWSQQNLQNSTLLSVHVASAQLQFQL